ncbi:hypothetical protein Nepgr_009566 [Nepenthes gracilis]|uniref:Exopolyphosphatase n=1 Tax=Nepenthes gracilis TaxID=150966 RepID=A0AAD3XKI2_NEPGR|nr:hypothetical protein Nepgr_009566 [Nepenthes gracilis]
MATSLRPTATQPSNLFAAIDMGTSSFKLLIVQFNSSTGKFTPIDRYKEPVALGRDTSSTSTPPTISPSSRRRALETLSRFQKPIKSRNIMQTRCVATSAVREATNRDDFLQEVSEKLNLQVNVLSGIEEAKLIYLGVLQFLPIFARRVLVVDIGGGSTEFVIGLRGKAIYAISLKLGHVTLTQQFHEDLVGMRHYIRSQIEESGLIENVRNLEFEIAVGSSGTVRAIEKVLCLNYGVGEVMNPVSGEVSRDWRFSRKELMDVFERLCGGGEEERVRRNQFFGRRSEFIVAGAVLLEEIFELLGINEMQVSGYGLGEGVVVEMIYGFCDDYDVNANLRWPSVVRLSTRFNGKNRMKFASRTAAISKEIFEGVRKSNEVAVDLNAIRICLNEKDLEYLEAACLLHNIGLCLGKKGYHKQSYNIIMKGDHLDGYTAEEIKLIALLARHHRKKFPRLDDTSLQEISQEVKLRFIMLCSILRISIIIQQYQSPEMYNIEFSQSCEGFKLVLKEIKDQPPVSSSEECMAEITSKVLSEELKRFEEVFHQKLAVVAHKSL